jgi:hypothetical protein
MHVHQANTITPDSPADRQRGIIDTSLMSCALLMQVGAGRGVGFARLLVAAGLRKLTAIDPGIIDHENIGQSEYGLAHVGLSKPEAMERVLREIASDALVTKFHCCADDVEDLNYLMQRHSLIKIGIDDPAAMFRLADRAQRLGVDCIVAGTQGDNRQFFVAGIFASGPPLGELLPAVFRGVAEKDRTPTFFPSCLVNATTVNVVAARIAIGVLHCRASSSLDVSDVGSAFIDRPLVVGLNGVHEPSGAFMPMRLIG